MPRIKTTSSLRHCTRTAILYQPSRSDQSLASYVNLMLCLRSDSSNSKPFSARLQVMDGTFLVHSTKEVGSYWRGAVQLLHPEFPRGWSWESLRCRGPGSLFAKPLWLDLCPIRRVKWCQDSCLSRTAKTCTGPRLRRTPPDTCLASFLTQCLLAEELCSKAFPRLSGAGVQGFRSSIPRLQPCLRAQPRGTLTGKTTQAARNI